MIELLQQHLRVIEDAPWGFSVACISLYRYTGGSIDLSLIVGEGSQLVIIVVPVEESLD